MRRPWKVRWFSPLYNEYTGKSFYYEKNARKLVETLSNNGIWDITIWCVNEQGYTDKIERIK